MRELTEHAAEGDCAPPPTLKAGETMAAAVKDLIAVGRQQVMAEGL